MPIARGTGRCRCPKRPPSALEAVISSTGTPIPRANGQVSMVFSDGDVDTTGDGVADTTSFFNKHEQFKDVMWGATMWDMVQARTYIGHNDVCTDHTGHNCVGHNHNRP